MNECFSVYDVWGNCDNQEQKCGQECHILVYSGGNPSHKKGLIPIRQLRLPLKSTITSVNEILLHHCQSGCMCDKWMLTSR